MGRRIKTLISFVAALLLIAVVIFWIRSIHHADMLLMTTPRGNLSGAVADRGGVAIAITDLAYGGLNSTSGSTWRIAGMSVPREQFLPTHDTLFDPPSVKYAFIGFKLAGGQPTISPQQSPKYTAVMIPYWSLIVVMALIALSAARGPLERRKRLRGGLCLGCGYDIRESTGRCPECGKAIPAKGVAVT